MYEQQILEDTLFHMVYGGVAVLNVIACFYLLFRRSNAIAPNITPPVRLRQWTAAFFAVMAFIHVWYVPIFFLTSSEAIQLNNRIGDLLDCMTFFPLGIIVFLTMLQDRRRPLWPVIVMIAPLVVGIAWCIASRSDDLIPVLRIYLIPLGIGFFTYMVRALRQYGRWLRDNYADLEHKELWQSIVVLAVTLVLIGFYSSDIGSKVYYYGNQVNNIVIVCYLLWRVETLSDLSIPESHDRSTSPLGLSKNIGPLLKQYCEEPQLYLQYDISLAQLAQQIGINRSYLSKHFALQGITYNAYINGLRIQHFINLYHQAVATHQPITVQQLAHQSGFSSYSTFNSAFKQSMGMTATAWMRASES